MKSFVILVGILLITQCLCDDDTAGVNIEQGGLLGKVEKTLFKKQNYYSFRGIPFAEAPTGKLRFQPPKPHKGWGLGRILEVYENKPTCIQHNTRHRNREPVGISGSEDCLYINVHTPDLEGKAPVIVFDYNDNFRTWFNGTDTYSPDFFMEEGVIVVTISHRLGVFGYLTTEDDVIPANNGLRDFILGLQWVKDNIEQFGGDPTKVTLMGSRGGAAIVDILLYSEKAKGLFSGAILQSGTALESLYFYEDSKERAFDIAKNLNLTVSNSDELLKELQKADTEKILDAEFVVLLNRHTGDDYTNRFPFTPSVEKDVESAVITTLPEHGKIVNDVPIIAGFNSKEGLDLLSHYFFDPRILSPKAEESLLALPIRTDFKFVPKTTKYKEATQAILDFYFEDKIVHYGNLMEQATYAADYSQNYALNLAAQKLSKSLSSSVFYYVFDFKGMWNENTISLSSRAIVPLGNSGATIIDELCYLLVCSRIKKVYNELINLPSQQVEFKVLKRMVRLWSNFAKTGNPTPAKEDDILKNFVWEPFSEEKDSKYLHITKVLNMKSNPLNDRHKFWDDFIEKYSKEAIDGVVRGEDLLEEANGDQEVTAEEDEEEPQTEETVQNESNSEDGFGIQIVNDYEAHDEL